MTEKATHLEFLTAGLRNLGYPSTLAVVRILMSLRR
jgi:hypothetical protein